MNDAPKLLVEEPEFQEARRGYDRNQVDDFLDRVADAVARLQRQLADTMERAKRAEAELAARPGSTGGDGEGTETITRTLLLAQRTADAAIAEARQEAEEHQIQGRVEAGRIVDEAKAAARNWQKEADEHLGKATAEAARIVAEAEVKARRNREAAEEALISEITELEGFRDAFRSDVAILERHLEEQRDRLRQPLHELQRLLDDPLAFRVEPVPELSGVEPLEPEAEPEVEPPAVTEVEPTAEHELPTEPAAEVTAPPGPDGDQNVDPEVGDELIELGPIEAGADVTVGEAEPAPVAAPPEHTGPSSSPPAPPTEDGEDAFLAELRKAMTDQEPLGPRETQPTAPAGASVAGEGDSGEQRPKLRRGRRR